MWNEQESEVIRLKKIFLQAGLRGKSLLGKFRAATREDVRLAAALLGYFSDDMGKEIYEEYLLRRIRPAVSALMEENRIEEIRQLEKTAGFSPEQVDEFLSAAIKMNRPEVIVWLLRRKEETYGYRDRDFSL